MHLKPCPFCGGEASRATCTLTRDCDTEGNKATFTGHYVNCIVCGSDNRGIAEGAATPEKAAERWNRRTVPEAGLIWIDLKERAPAQGQCVLVATDDFEVKDAYRNERFHGGFERNGRYVHGVTHWAEFSFPRVCEPQNEPPK